MIIKVIKEDKGLRVKAEFKSDLLARSAKKEKS
jgi:hypothetical protein